MGDDVFFNMVLVGMVGAGAQVGFGIPFYPLGEVFAQSLLVLGFNHDLKAGPPEFHLHFGLMLDGLGFGGKASFAVGLIALVGFVTDEHVINSPGPACQCALGVPLVFEITGLYGHGLSLLPGGCGNGDFVALVPVPYGGVSQQVAVAVLNILDLPLSISSRSLFSPNPLILLMVSTVLSIGSSKAGAAVVFFLTAMITISFRIKVNR